MHTLRHDHVSKSSFTSAHCESAPHVMNLPGAGPNATSLTLLLRACERKQPQVGENSWVNDTAEVNAWFVLSVCHAGEQARRQTSQLSLSPPPASTLAHSVFCATRG